MMCPEPVIHVESLGKCYHTYRQPHDRLKHAIYPRLRRWLGLEPRAWHGEFWAVRDISFSVGAGETVGIIGRNGSGKSTLLQIICGTLQASTGEVRTQGRIAALLELGAGFNPEFTGRENVRMGCALLGLTAEESEARFPDIAGFADIGDFMDQPVKTYSSGMFVRLAFAVNIVCEPRVMIVDEALAVGDMNFQAKCITALAALRQRGATVLFVSHDLGAVRSLCDRAIWLEHGSIRAIGPAPDVVEDYIRAMRMEMTQEQARFAPAALVRTRRAERGEVAQFVRSADFSRRAASRYGNGQGRITYAEWLSGSAAPARHFSFDDEATLVVCFESDVDADLLISYYILDKRRNMIAGFEHDVAARAGGCYTVTFDTRLPLAEGHYSIQLELSRPLVYDETAEYLDVVDDSIVFEMARRPRGRVWAQVRVPNRVTVREAADEGVREQAGDATATEMQGALRA